MIRRFNSGSGFDDCGNEKRFVNIDTTASLINNFYGQKLLSKKDKEAIDCSITHLTEKLKQFLLYGLIEPLICAWKMELTLITMLSKTKKVFTTYLPVLCSIASRSYYIGKVEVVETFITICAAN